MNDIDTTLGPALRERLRTEVPDLEHLAAASLRSGLRLRRRRRIAAAAGGAAAVTVIGVAASQTGGGTTARDPDVAASTTAPAAPAATVTTDVPDVPKVDVPLAVSVPGWTCGEYADEKIPCTKGDLFVSVNLRDAAEHDTWVADADKGGSSLWVSPVRGEVFVSVAGGPLDKRDLDAFVAGIRFSGAAPRP